MKRINASELSACPSDIASAISFLRRRGFSKVESIHVLVEHRGLGLADAKAAIHLSDTWRDVLDSDERFHEVLIGAIGATAPITEADLPSADQFERFHPFIKGLFSQWHRTVFSLDGKSFVTAEQWMMFSKAKIFGDEERAREILATADPAEQKRLGQQVRNFTQLEWDETKIDIVFRGNRAKFGQNGGALRQLRATGNAMLVEANPRDWVWGAGLSMDDPKVHRPNEWPGANLLGRVLTKVRSDLT